MKALLLNPPGKKIYFRDYYCAKISKAGYYYHPVDLVYLSGRLSNVADVHIIDAIAEKLNHEACQKKIKELYPDIIIFLSSAPSYNEDILFFSGLKAILPSVKLIGTGDVFRELKTIALESNPFIDALLLDFSTNDIITYLFNNHKGMVIPNIIYRDDELLVEGKETHHSGIFDTPLPRWDLFNMKNYRFPFAKKKPFASILTDFGCPYSCDFCPISSLGYKLREISSVVEELNCLKNLGIKELYIRDQTFGVSKQRTSELLEVMLKENLNFSWTCLTRTDILDDDLLALMKKAGCHTIMVGIETADNNILNLYKKHTNTEQSVQAVSNIKKYNIRVCGFFMVGFPGETRDSVIKTAEFACSLPIDYASFNITVHRFGTPFRKNAVDLGYIDPLVLETESSESPTVCIENNLSDKEILLLKKKAVMMFYLRPLYIIRRLLNIKSFLELQNLFREGLELLRKNS